MHTMFKDTQITMYEDKGSQGKSRMQALLEKDLDRERVYSHTPQSNFTLAHLYQDLELNFANLAQLTQALPPGTLFAVGLESHSRLTCQVRQ